jgi:hypothetical protein
MTEIRFSEIIFVNLNLLNNFDQSFLGKVRECEII